ncbi:MAG: sulfatase [Saprospiraceae bacterium]|nr:sulfatase [Saprospiraceae bacterium]
MKHGIRKAIIITWASVQLLAILSGQSPKSLDQKRNKQPNILLIVSEDNGPDLNCYGVAEVKSPNLDRLAAEGMLFENASVTYSVCSPSRSTIFTGLYPFQNGQMGLATHGYRMYDEAAVNTLPVLMKKGGYRTACLGKIHVNPESAIPFDFRPIKNDNFEKKGLPEYAVQAASFMKAGEEPFFLMVNFPDAHFPLQKQVEGMPAHPIEAEDMDHCLPYVGANSKRLQEFTANYYNGMMRLDESVGMLLDSLRTSGKAENTIIIYLGDHGAQFSRGKCTNYEAGLKVPMIVSWPGHIQAAQRFAPLVSSIDLFPSILDAAGVKSPVKVPGVSLWPYITRKQKKWKRQYVFAASEGSTPFWYYPLRSVRNERFKLILHTKPATEDPIYSAYETHKGHFAGGANQEEIDAAPLAFRKAYATWKNPPVYEFYDLENDPLELNNLSENKMYAGEMARLQKVLYKWRKRSGDPFLDPAKTKLYEEEVHAILQKYPRLDYMKDPDFKWNYPQYFTDK